MSKEIFGVVCHGARVPKAKVPYVGASGGVGGGRGVLGAEEWIEITITIAAEEEGLGG